MNATLFNTGPKIGDKYGKLTIIEKLPNRVTHYQNGNTSSVRMVRCKCDCGNVIDVIFSQLTRGMTKTCGCCVERELIGKKFNKLTVIEYVGIKKSLRYFKCKCDCGNEVVVKLSSITSNHTKSCGHCIEYETVGKQYGHLTVISYIGKDNYNRNVFKCRCDCGNVTTTTYDYLNRVKNPICGKCYKAIPNSYIPYIYQNCLKLKLTYDRILKRCQDPNDYSFYRYGGRGIKCDVSLLEFISHFAKSFDNNKQIDRINNDGNYSLDNLKLSSPIDNANNRIQNYNVSYESLALQLITDITFKQLTINGKHYDCDDDFYIVEYDKVTKFNTTIVQYIHKSLVNDVGYFISFIKDNYTKWGGSISVVNIRNITSSLL